MGNTDSKNTHQPAQLTGRLGTTGIVFMVVAAAAPLTVIGGNMPLGIGLGNGAGAPVGFLIAALILLLFSVGFVTMTPHVREAGAFFSYVTLGLGKRAGMGIAVVALVSYTAIQVGIYGYIGWAIDDTVRFYGGPSIPWPIYALFTLAIVAFLGYRHIDLSAKVLGVALVAEIGIVLVLDFAILINPGPAGITVESFAPDTFLDGAIGVAILFALTGFIGFESTAVFRNEARSPERTVPRATYIAVLIIGGFYAFTCWAFVVAIGPDSIAEVAQRTLDGEANMLLDTTNDQLGHVGRDIVNVLLLTSLFACVLSFHNVIARYQFVLGGMRILPKPLAAVHPKHHSPSVSSLVQTGTALILVAVFAIFRVDPLVGVFGSMAGVATVGMTVLMLSTSIAVIVFFVRNSAARAGRRWRTILIPILASVGLLAGMGLVLSNFTLVTGGSVQLSAGLAAIPFVALIVGWLIGRDRRGVAEEPSNAN
ncbi:MULTISPECIES: APC family permease [unclassified Brevibacterium]|uniref:APC family permease n=1 Tax=unclassified Brevibacterium TaxID=2614124 RepID=UPI001E4E676E|nr:MULTISPECIES: APC family permease [unclassified Brevibacterium]MCD1286102.1 amino acid transporter [Brevibacterium sp. CCUG 69071]MDK8433453.1 APC family permease [Brevibacterium sp. H-BE7]